MATGRYEKMTGEVVAACRGFVQRSIAPLQASVRGLVQRADVTTATLGSCVARLEQLEDRVRRLEGR